MNYKKLSLLGAITLLFTSIASVGVADSVTVTVTGPYSLQAKWASPDCGLPEAKINFVDVHGSIHETLHSWYSVMEDYARVNKDYHSLLEEIANTLKPETGDAIKGSASADWPLYNKVKAAGGVSTFQLPSVCANKNSPTAVQLKQAVEIEKVLMRYHQGQSE